MIPSSLQEVLSNRPRALVSALGAKGTQQAMSAAAERLNLTADQRVSVETELILVALNLTPYDQLQNNIWRALGCDLETAHHISHEVETTVLRNILASSGDAPPPQTTQDGAAATATPTQAKPSSLEAQLGGVSVTKHQDHTRAVGQEEGEATKQGAASPPESENGKPKKEVVDPYREPFV